MLVEPLSANDAHVDSGLLAAIVALNNAHAVELSFADEARMELKPHGPHGSAG
ncbi:hypothetical protein [Novosphingobium sp. 9]|uniref:hypothetical protein n=1 Tax=Novosphingobium sp. 9 TaxID=2025349 RepID=UPI0021B68B2A|nr:hypothetical protein [Novosphingobium sp. 9]